MRYGYILTKFDDEPATATWSKKIFEDYEARKAPDPGDHEGMVILLWPKVFASNNDAAGFAQWAAEDFFQVLGQPVTVLWEPSQGRMDGRAVGHAYGTDLPLYFRIREVEIASDDGPIYVMSLTSPPDDRELALNEGVVFTTLDDAKRAAIIDRNVTEERWKKSFGTELETDLGDKGLDLIINCQDTLWTDKDV